MTRDEFLDEIRYLEAAKSGPPARSKEDKELRQLRRTAIFDVVQLFSIEVFAEARIRLCQTTSPQGKYFPSADEIYAVCQEVEEEFETPTATETFVSRFNPPKHKCSTEKPACSPALDLLMRCSPYDAQHIECPGEIKATCTHCGARHIETTIIGGIMKLFPEETKNWNPHFKGLLPCSNCEKHKSNS